MKKFILINLFFFSFLSVFAQDNIEQLIEKKEQFFEQNIGQLYDQNKIPVKDVLFTLKVKNGTVLIKKNGYSIQKLSQNNAVGKTGKNITPEFLKNNANNLVSIERVDLLFEGALPNPSVQPKGLHQGIFSYIDKKNSSKSFSPDAYEKVIVKNIYPFIDIEYFIDSTTESFKYNFILHSGADVRSIQMQYGSLSPIVFSPSQLSYKLLGESIVETIPESYYLNPTVTGFSSRSIQKDAFDESIINKIIIKKFFI